MISHNIKQSAIYEGYCKEHHRAWAGWPHLQPSVFPGKASVLLGQMCLFSQQGLQLPSHLHTHAARHHHKNMHGTSTGCQVCASQEWEFVRITAAGIDSQHQLQDTSSESTAYHLVLYHNSPQKECKLCWQPLPQIVCHAT